MYAITPAVFCGVAGAINLSEQIIRVYFGPQLEQRKMVAVLPWTDAADLAKLMQVRDRRRKPPRQHGALSLPRVSKETQTRVAK